jgi:hypothetical protein
MHVFVDANGIVTLKTPKQNPEVIRSLIQKLKDEHGIKNLKEIAKIFNLRPVSGGRLISSWCADEDKASHQKMPANNFAVLCQLTGHSDILLSKEA